jgi:hypothetical protein
MLLAVLSLAPLDSGKCVNTDGEASNNRQLPYMEQPPKMTSVSPSKRNTCLGSGSDLLLRWRSQLLHKFLSLSVCVWWRICPPPDATSGLWVGSPLADTKSDKDIWSKVKLSRWTASVVRVPGYRSRGPGIDSRRYQIFWEVLGLERGPLSLVSRTEELLGGKSRRSGLENRDYGRGDPSTDHATHSIRKRWH